MRIHTRWLAAAGVAGVLIAALVLGESTPRQPEASGRPELEYLKVVNRAAPPRDPQLLFLLMAQYVNAGRQREGAEFLSSLTNEFAPRLTDSQKSLYLAATALLRAQAAAEVSLLNRIQWVRQTVAMLDEAKQLSHGEIFVVRWISGVVRAQLPGFFGQHSSAVEDLQWCLDRADTAPHPGWLREVHYRLDALRGGGEPLADRPITLVTPFGEDPSTGHSFSARRIAAGTRPDSARSAYEALRAAFPALPPLSTILVTHAHWDHIGGHRYFASLEPKPRFIARSNYAGEIEVDLKAPRAYLKSFFGERFDIEELRSFKPDATVERQTQLRLGGTRVELIPIEGGETHDGLFINLPDLGVLFVGDFIMPYLGAPFVEEGDLGGLLKAIDIVAQKNPRHLLHGHEPLTRLFNSAAMLADMKSHLAWLREQVSAAIRNGTDRAALQQANLIPPQLLASDPATHVAYLVMRENVINRLYDQNA